MDECTVVEKRIIDPHCSWILYLFLLAWFLLTATTVGISWYFHESTEAMYLHIVSIAVLIVLFYLLCKKICELKIKIKDRIINTHVENRHNELNSNNDN